MKAPLQEIGARLRSERIRLGHKQGELAELAGVHTNSISHYEGGDRPMNVAFLLVLRDLGIDIGYVVTGRRDDGSLGLTDKQLIEMFGLLSMREKEAVMSLLFHLTGRVVDADTGRADLVRALQPAGTTLHTSGNDYRHQGDG